MAVESPAGESQWSDEQVIQTLSEAGQAEFGEQVAEPTSTAPEGESQPAAEPQGQADAQVAPEPTQPEETFDGGKFNPDELPPELQEGWKQLQAAFTQKTQELAAQRQQLEALGDPESLQQAVELYNRIGDPQNWAQLHSELTYAMQQAGMTPAEAQAAATEAINQEQQAQAESQFSTDDPEIEPLVNELSQLRSRLDQVEQQRQQELMNAEAERQYIQAVTELQRQEAAIRDAHPEWDDAKIEAAYQMSSFFNGNLAQGAQRLEQLLSAERELYLSQKAGAMNDSTRTPATTFQPDAVKADSPATLQDAAAEAEEYFKALLAEEG